MKWGAALLFLALCATFLYCWRLAPVKVIGWGQTIQFDDFFFEVRDARPATLAGRSFWIVQLGVHNRAKRVPFRFSPDIVRVKDEKGHVYRVSEFGQQQLQGRPGADRSTERTLPAGTSCVVDLALELPEEVRNPRLDIRFGGPLGALLDALIYGRREIRLTPRE